MAIAMALPRRCAPARMSSMAAPVPYNDDAELVAALHRGERVARTVLVQRYEPLVERLVAGALGIDSEISDVIQDVFVGVFEGIRSLKDASALRSWIATLAVFTARGRIRRRRRWRWIRFLAPEDVPEVPVTGPQGETHEAVRATYRVLDALPDDERMAFSLRFVSEMQLTEVAAACRVSLATVKRRLARAEKRFVEAAKDHPRCASASRTAAAGARPGEKAKGTASHEQQQSRIADARRGAHGADRRAPAAAPAGGPGAARGASTSRRRQPRRCAGGCRCWAPRRARRGSRSSCCARSRCRTRSTARACTRRGRGRSASGWSRSDAAPLALRFSDGSRGDAAAARAGARRRARRARRDGRRWRRAPSRSRSSTARVRAGRSGPGVTGFA